MSYETNYTIEKIYLLVGKDDKICLLTFKHDSDAYKKYGHYITVVFLYTQREREEMDKLVLNEPFSNHGRIKVDYLNSELSKDKVDLLLNEGIYSEDIADISYYDASNTNVFHSTEKRILNKLEIPMTTSPKGKDYDWIYGFARKLVNDGVGQSPEEISFYLAGKLYYEPENITEADKQVIYDENGNLNTAIELELLLIKYIREDISVKEKQKLAKLHSKKKQQRIKALDNYLKQAGSSLKKLLANNPEKAAELVDKVLRFKERRINILGKYPIYINLDSYLHIYMRHVEEFKINKHFEHKDNFLWKEEDVFNVIEHVIEQIDVQYQKYKEEKPYERFSKYDKQSIYFQGDYYTFHIDPNGRISTFHRNKKEHDNI
ncbi:MAG: hypothetical protein V4620_05425 [Bacteroidota bacterium]